MDTHILISVIVPFYNVESYINECLSSLSKQIFKEYEVICVDDCSPDDSRKIVKNYTNQYLNFKLITHTKNQGLGPARNTGVANAKGKYICFIDSDDYVNPNYLFDLYNAISKGKSEMAMMNSTIVSENSVILQEGSSLESKTVSVKTFLNTSEYYPAILPVWNKIFIKKLLIDIPQLPIVSEDQPFLAKYFLRCKNISIVTNPSYYYRNREGTLSKPKEHNLILWEDFFYSQELFFQTLKTRFSNNDLKTQLEIRVYSILWRFDNFHISLLDDFEDQKSYVLDQLTKPVYSIRRNIILYSLMRLLFSTTNPQKFDIKLKKAMKLCRIMYYGDNLIFVAFKKIIKYFISQSFTLLSRFEESIFSILSKPIRRKDIWLIGERMDTFEENGMYFYKYLSDKHPEKKYFYITDSNDLIKDLKHKALRFNSLQHKLYFKASKYYINSQYDSDFPKSYFGHHKYHKSKGTANIFLQHGITYADVSKFYGKKNSSIDKFICGAIPEYKYILNHFGYNKDELGLTGFARFDGLIDTQSRNQILFMPSWRRELENISLEEFKQSSYFLQIKSFLSSKSLCRVLNENDINLIFYPHYLVHPYIACFTSLENNRIKILQHENVQNLLKTSTLLITDVSSVQFDFVYMKKPVIYFQWDYENIIRNHLSKGYFDFKKGFGPLTTDVNSLIKEIRILSSQKFTMPLCYQNKVNSFFPFIDKNNCDRIYTFILQ